ncbi:MAG: hypothetical protein OXD47_00200 [Gammaproteobacteria bacterium]|nr:hypothetical protein [Gammaproteobacteria bacterium]MCY4337205.1 hypothetical protein [Gammaproteobacteria bacterium]
MRLDGGSRIVENLQRAHTGSFRRGKIGADGAFQSVSETSGLRGWLVDRMASGKVNEHSWQGRAIKVLVGGQQNLDALRTTLRDNRKTSLVNASNLLLNETAPEVQDQDRAALKQHLAGSLLEVVRTRGSATAKFETIQSQAREFTRVRQARREQSAENVRNDATAQQVASSATETRQTAPAGSHARREGVPGGSLIFHTMPRRINFIPDKHGPILPGFNDQIQPLLDEYYQELATVMTAQQDAERAQTGVKLNEMLDRIEAKIVLNQEQISLADIGGPQAHKFLSEFQMVVDDNRALVVDLVNNYGAGHAGTGAQPMTWRHALQLKRLGLNVGANVSVGNNQNKQVVSKRKLGEGNFNTVHKLTFADQSTAVFKPGVMLETVARGRPLVSDHAGIPEQQPRYEARSIASSQLDELLGSSLLVKTEFHEHKGNMGTLMELAQGTSMEEFVTAAKNKDFPMTMHRDVNRLQLLDAITGQLDRHSHNVMVETDSAGAYQRLKGIDNDTSFAANADYNDLEEFRNWAYDESLRRHLVYNPAYPTAAANNSGLPPVADATFARRILARGFAQEARNRVQGLLTPRETELLDERIEQVQDHLKSLERKGLLVTDWDSGVTQGGQSVTKASVADDTHSQAVAWGLLKPRARR